MIQPTIGHKERTTIRKRVRTCCTVSVVRAASRGVTVGSSRTIVRISDLTNVGPQPVDWSVRFRDALKRLISHPCGSDHALHEHGRYWRSLSGYTCSWRQHVRVPRADSRFGLIRSSFFGPSVKAALLETMITLTVSSGRPPPLAIAVECIVGSSKVNRKGGAG